MLASLEFHIKHYGLINTFVYIRPHKRGPLLLLILKILDLQKKKLHNNIIFDSNLRGSNFEENFHVFDGFTLIRI